MVGFEPCVAQSKFKFIIDFDSILSKIKDKPKAYHNIRQSIYAGGYFHSQIKMSRTFVFTITCNSIPCADGWCWHLLKPLGKEDPQTHQCYQSYWSWWNSWTVAQGMCGRIGLYCCSNCSSLYVWSFMAADLALSLDTTSLQTETTVAAKQLPWHPPH